MRPLSAIVAMSLSLALGFGQGDADQNASLDRYRKELQTNRSSSLAHFRIGEIYFQQKNYQGAANEFRETLNGDLQPRSLEAEAHLNLAAIFTMSGQLDRAQNENRLAVLAISRNQSKTPDVAPQPLQKTEPEYSEEARLAGLEGTVLLRGTITEQGIARDMQVTGSLGFGLDEKALEAIQQWRFEAAYQAQPVTVSVDFRLPDIQSRWHLIRADFQPSPGVSRPHFLRTKYPLGAGISLNALEEALVIRAIGREATATVAFDVDEHGNPVNFRVLSASHPIWGPEALAVVREWQFAPGMKNGAPASVPCTVDLVWGPTNLSRPLLEWAQAALRISQNNPGANTLHSTIIYQSEASYTEEAREAGLQGTVTLALTINADGTASDIRVIKPLGMGLDEKASEAVSQWRFRPSLIDGQPAAVPAVIEVNFRLPK